MTKPLYSVSTWDTDEQAYTPQVGVTVPAFNITLWQLRHALKELRQMGYTAHRYRDPDGEHDDNDWSVLVERTDGRPEAEIRKGWERGTVMMGVGDVSDLPKLTRRDVAALLDMQRYTTYHWRPETMRRLEDHGYVVRCSSPGKVAGWRLTECGLEALNHLSDGTEL